jgi:hypothetical protein
MRQDKNDIYLEHAVRSHRVQTNIVDMILNSSEAQSLPLENFRLILDTLDSASQAIVLSSSSLQNRRNLLDSESSIFSPLDSYSQHILEGMNDGQSEISDIKTSFRLICQMLEMNSTFSSPQSDLEKLLMNQPSSSVQLISNSTEQTTFPVASALPHCSLCLCLASVVDDFEHTLPSHCLSIFILSVFVSLPFSRCMTLSLSGMIVEQIIDCEGVGTGSISPE